MYGSLRPSPPSPGWSCDYGHWIDESEPLTPKILCNNEQSQNQGKTSSEWNHLVDLLHISRALEAQPRMGVRPRASCAIRALSWKVACRGTFLAHPRWEDEWA